MLAPFPVFEAQARAVLHAFNVFDSGIEDGRGTRGIDKQAEAAGIFTRWEILKKKFNGNERDVIKFWHRFEEQEQFTYRDYLAGFVQTDPSRVERWEYDAFRNKILLRITWVKIEKSGQADKWLQGVGKGGLNDWIALIKKVIEYGEELDSNKNSQSINKEKTKP
jgi:hypothetical protein